jgi:hypothetical protein
MLFSSLDLEYGADSPWHGIWVFITGLFIYGLKTVLRNYFKTALRNLLRIIVDNIDTALERVKERGGQVLNGPMEVPGGDRVAQCLDPQGADFGLHERKK